MQNFDTLVIDAGFCTCREEPCVLAATSQPKKLLLFGDAGSGKSTLAKAIGSASQAAVLHLDDVQFGPNWESKSSSEVQQIVAEFQASHDSYVVEGNLPQGSASLVREADLVVWLDVSFWRSLYRLTRRVWGDYCNSRTICGGNRDSFWQMIHPWESCIAKKIRKRLRKRRDIRKVITDVPHVILRHDDDIHEWLWKTYPKVRRFQATSYRALIKEVIAHDE